jgi:uncharacterized membrane protein
MLACAGARPIADSPTLPPPVPDMQGALQRNIQALHDRRQQEQAAATRQERVAEAITAFTGSMRFVYLHLALYGGWILVNLGVVPGVAPFDPSFVILAMEASVEAIFLSTFVLISQNRMGATAEKRAELDLQISLLTEHELTKLATMVDRIARRLDLPLDPAMAEVEKEVAPEAVLDQIEAKRGS